MQVEVAGKQLLQVALERKRILADTSVAACGNCHHLTWLELRKAREELARLFL